MLSYTQSEGSRAAERQSALSDRAAAESGSTEGDGMEQDTRIAVIGIIVEDKNAVNAVNRLLHDYGDEIIGRMGLPYQKKQVNIISVVVDAPADRISALAGKLGRLPGVSAKALYSRQNTGTQA